MASTDVQVLLSIIALVEWSVSRGQLTEEQAIAVIHAAVDEAFPKDGDGGSGSENVFRTQA